MSLQLLHNLLALQIPNINHIILASAYSARQSTQPLRLLHILPTRNTKLRKKTVFLVHMPPIRLQYLGL